MRHSGHFTEQTTAAMEMAIFGDDKFIESNSFATSHQTVNVYGQPEKRYEIRSEDTAVDVQVHRVNEAERDIPQIVLPTEQPKAPDAKPAEDRANTGIKIGDKVKHKLG